jgi:hypothetical protein
MTYCGSNFLKGGVSRKIKFLYKDRIGVYTIVQIGSDATPCTPNMTDGVVQTWKELK